jgi:hypothetical protein
MQNWLNIEPGKSSVAVLLSGLAFPVAERHRKLASHIVAGSGSKTSTS